jgi:hypothetical protein
VNEQRNPLDELLLDILNTAQNKLVPDLHRKTFGLIAHKFHERNRVNLFET